MIDDITSGDRGAILLWISVLPLKSYITSTEASTLAAYVEGTETDPAWAAIDATDIQLARACVTLRAQAAEGYNNAIALVDSNQASGTVPTASEIIATFQGSVTG